MTCKRHLHGPAASSRNLALLSLALGGLFAGCADSKDHGAAEAGSVTPAPAGPVAPSGGTTQPPPGAQPPGGTAGLPCAVATVLAKHCSTCHGETPRFGAPMPLVTRAQLRAPARSNPERAVFELVLERIKDVQRPMPPPPNPAATEAEIAVIQDWVAAGAPAGEACGEMPAAPDGGMAELPPPHPDCDHVIELRAHGLPFAGDQTPYAVAPLTDLYVNFTFDLPWTGSAHGVSFYPIVDNDRVLHHWLLYAAPVGLLPGGSIAPGIGTHPGESLVAGWAPGGVPAVMPDGVGIELPDGPVGRFTLEMHYHNDSGMLEAPDRSGVRVCATTRKRPQTAAVHLLGTEAIAMALPGEHRFTGVCHPWLNPLADRSPVHILTSSPHLHKRGRHLTTKIHRADGVTTDILLDTPFDFNNQIIHQTPATIYPGDWLETTCTYEHAGGVATFGIRTEDEMCQNYVTAWPVGALDTGGTVIFERHACML